MAVLAIGLCVTGRGAVSQRRDEEPNGVKEEEENDEQKGGSNNGSGERQYDDLVAKPDVAIRRSKLHKTINPFSDMNRPVVNWFEWAWVSECQNHATHFPTVVSGVKFVPTRLSRAGQCGAVAADVSRRISWLRRDLRRLSSAATKILNKLDSRPCCGGP